MDIPALSPPSSPPPGFSSLPGAETAKFVPPTFKPKGNKLWLILGLVLILLAIGFLLYKFFPRGKIGAAQVTLTYWGLFEPPAVFQQVIAEFEKTHPQVKIQYSQENLKFYRERLQNSLAKGQGPDLFRFHQSWVPMLASYLSPLPASVYDLATFEQTFYPSARESLKLKGQYVGVPLEFDGLALYYNEDLLRAAGVSPPKTWDELRKAAISLTVRDEQGKIRTAGVALGTAKNIDHWSDILALMMMQNGVDLSHPASNFGVDALSYFTAFTRLDRVWESTLPFSTYAFAKGMVAMYFGPSWRTFEIKELNPALNFRIIPVPQLPGNDITWASFWVEGVSKTSKNQALAWEFLKYLSSKEIMQKLYQTETILRGFGEPYSRQDLADLLKSQPYVSPYLEGASQAKNWFLSSATSDNGLNQQITKYYEDAVNAVEAGGDSRSALNTASLGIDQVFKQYGLQ